MIVVVITLIILCVIVFAGVMAYLATADGPMTDGQALTILITVIILVALCWAAGAMTNEPRYFYEGMRVEKEDIDFSEFTMTYDAEKNCYNLERREK